MPNKIILVRQAFRALGADLTFLEAPQSETEMEQYCSKVEGPKLANMLEHGLTPILPHSRLESMGYALAAYPLTLLSASMKAQLDVLRSMKEVTQLFPMWAPDCWLRDVARVCFCYSSYTLQTGRCIPSTPLASV